MYEVSNAYKAAVYQTPIRAKLEGTITLLNGDTIDIYDNPEASNVVRDSVSINNKAVSKEKLEFGSVYVGELKISLYDDIDRYQLYGAEIQLSEYRMIAGGTYEAVPLGIFIVSQAVRNKKVVSITAYDRMQLLDEPFNMTETSGAPYALLSYISNLTGIELAQTEAQIKALPNGQRISVITENMGYSTYRDVVSDIAAQMACFATITRDGKLILKNFGTSVTEVVTESRRRDTNIADRVIHYDTLRMQVKKTVYTTVVSGQEVGMSLYEMDTIPTVGQNHVENYIKETLQNIIDAIAEIEYTPITCDILPNPALDLGDYLQIKTGTDTECYAPIMAYEWHYHGRMTIKAVGESTTSGQSKTSKIAADAADVAGGQETVITAYENARAFTINQDFKQIIRLDYVSTKATEGLFHASILVKVEAPVTVLFKYLINNSEDLNFHPAQTLAAGSHIITLFYPLSAIPANRVNNFRVQAAVNEGRVNIDVMQIKAALTAQGLNAGANEWNGTIEIEETYEDIQLGNVELADLSEVVSAAADAPASGTVSDIFTGVTLGSITIAGLNEYVSADTSY